MDKDNLARGTFIVLEGTDGSGKGTQLALLAEQLSQAGYEVEVFDFPRYAEGSSYFVKRYLKGNYGSGESVGPYTGSLFYALDRYDAADKIRAALTDGKIVLVNRFTASNMAHQGTKFINADERRGYFIWLDNLEFALLGIPRPDLNIVLRVSAEIAQKLAGHAQARDADLPKRDIHEADLNHFKRAITVYDELCQLFPKDFTSIDCVRNGELLDAETISKLVRAKVNPWLPKPTRKKRPTNAKAASTATENDLSADDEIIIEHTRAPQLEAVVEHPAQSIRAISYDQKDESGKYHYHIPSQFDETTGDKYRQVMDSIFDNYSQLVRQLTDYIRQQSDTPDSERDSVWQAATRAQACAAARPMLPVAADEPTALEQIAQSGADNRETIQTFVNQHLQSTYAPAAGQLATLVDVWPRNELDLVADILYEHSDLPLRDIRQQVTTWPYEQKLEVFQAFASKPGVALEKARYSWDMVCNYGSFRDLQQHYSQVAVNDLAWQMLTPRFGYDIPKLVEEAGLVDSYEACFDASLGLHSFLQQQGYELEAQYAVLTGHNMRWKVTYNARTAFQLHKLLTTPERDGDSQIDGYVGYRTVIVKMHDKLREIHPLLGEALYQA